MPPRTQPTKLTNRSGGPRGRPPRTTGVSRGGLNQRKFGGVRRQGRSRGRPPNRPRIPIQQTPPQAPDSDFSDPSPL